jgi:hypothetical protein
MSTNYEELGYQIFRTALPIDQIDAFAKMARQDIPAYQGEILRRSGRMECNIFHDPERLVQNDPANIHVTPPKGLEAISAALRAIIASPAIYDALHSLDGASHYTIHQTILFLAPPGTDVHLDSWTVDTVPRGFSHTVWIPLQDLEYRSGVPSVIPWPRGKLLSDSDLGISVTSSMSFREHYERYHQALQKRVMASSPDVCTAFMRRGDFIVWSSLTPHCTLPSQPSPRERLSLQVIVRPSHYRWGNFANQPSEMSGHPTEPINDRFATLLA